MVFILNCAERFNLSAVDLLKHGIEQSGKARAKGEVLKIIASLCPRPRD